MYNQYVYNKELIKLDSVYHVYVYTITLTTHINLWDLKLKNSTLNGFIIFRNV